MGKKKPNNFYTVKALDYKLSAQNVYITHQKIYVNRKLSSDFCMIQLPS